MKPDAYYDARTPEERLAALEAWSDEVSYYSPQLLGDTFCVDLAYPRCDGNAKFIQIGLMDVRAADDIRISYDFNRDGWSVQQASRFCWRPDDKAYDSDWQEVAFVQAWGREETKEQTDARMGWGVENKAEAG